MTLQIDLPAHSGGFAPLIARGLTFCDSSNTELYNDPSTNTTLHILVNVISAVAAAFPDALFHLGGDETVVIPGTPCDYAAIHLLEQYLQVLWSPLFVCERVCE